MVELPGTDPTLIWETPELALDHIEAFLTGIRRTAQPTRILATVLFTDIVDSTERASQLGDRRWRELLNVHDELARRLVEEFGGQVIKTTGDGILATSMGPAGRSAVQLPSRLSWIAIGGIAVHIAARVMAAAQPGDILTSRTVRDLIVGSDITLLDHGRQRLKGVEGTWQLFSAMQP